MTHPNFRKYNSILGGNLLWHNKISNNYNRLFKLHSRLSKLYNKHKQMLIHSKCNKLNNSYNKHSSKFSRRNNKQVLTHNKTSSYNKHKNKYCRPNNKFNKLKLLAKHSKIKLNNGSESHKDLKEKEVHSMDFLFIASSSYLIKT